MNETFSRYFARRAHCLMVISFCAPDCIAASMFSAPSCCSTLKSPQKFASDAVISLP
jgi:hypothetical protein